MGTITRGFANFIGPDGKLQQGSLAAGVGGPAWQSVVVADGSTGLTAVAGRAYPINTTSGTITVTLPATPSTGDEIILLDYAGTFASNNLTISATPKINGSDNDVKLTTNREATRLVYIDSTQGWLAYSGVNEGTAPSLTDISPPYSVDFLVIAGGGGGGQGTGGSFSAGGGGAGGYRNSFSTETSGGNGSSETSLTFTSGIVYTITVGGGGAAAPSAGTKGVSGFNSEISGTGISTITSTGGGAGGGYTTAPNNAGSSGGSGGGGGDTNSPPYTAGSGGSGTANQGFAGGNSTGGAENGGGGGGGAGAAGSNGTPNSGGAGGAGLASSITGSSISRGGGGGGASESIAAAGGIGGGGNGADDGSSSGVAGNANTGGGGGAGSNAELAAAGGKGVVILRIPTANYSGTTTGSPTVTTDGSDKVIVFNDSGSITG